MTASYVGLRIGLIGEDALSHHSRKAAVSSETTHLEPERHRLALRFVPLGVALITFLVFARTLQNGFVSWDDDKNFVTNPYYRGLGLTQLRWMWTTFHLGHYVPLSWMTLGLDHAIWGMNPVGYHLTNLLLHTANAVLLYLIANRLFAFTDHADGRHDLRRVLPATLAALLFAVHPLRVESVAWATERRDVLSALFFLSSILLYLRSRDAGTGKSYWIALLAFACALLSKGTAVTLPAILFILNIYPLRRLGGDAGWWSDETRRVYRELAPFFALSAAASAMTLLALQHLDQLGVSGKLAVSAYSLAFYVRKMVAPVGLSPLYAMPATIDATAGRYLAAYCVALALCGAAWFSRRRSPAAAAAWAAFVVVLFPLLGFVQNGPQLAADRYTYYAAPALTLLAAAALFHYARPAVATSVAAVALAWLAVLTWRQTHVWHDSETLWTQVLNVEPESPIGRNNWGNIVAARGQWDEAVQQYERAVQTSPRYAEGHNNLGVALSHVGRLGEAVAQFRDALAIDPRYADAQNNWGVATIQQGDADGAMEHYRLALAINPSNADAHTNWGNALVRIGRPADAERHYEEAITLRPDHADAHLNWGVALARQGKLAEAITQFRQALAINPNHAEAKEYLARALQLQQHANAQSPRD